MRTTCNGENGVLAVRHAALVLAVDLVLVTLLHLLLVHTLVLLWKHKTVTKSIVRMVCEIISE